MRRRADWFIDGQLVGWILSGSLTNTKNFSVFGYIFRFCGYTDNHKHLFIYTKHLQESSELSCVVYLRCYRLCLWSQAQRYLRVSEWIYWLWQSTKDYTNIIANISHRTHTWRMIFHLDFISFARITLS